MIRNRKSMLEARIARLERMTKNEGIDGARVKKELLNLVKDGVVTWEELARECIYWMPTNIAWSVIGELGEGYGDDLDDDMIDDSQEADDFEMPDFDKADADESMKRRVFKRKHESNRKFCR